MRGRGGRGWIQARGVVGRRKERVAGGLVDVGDVIEKMVEF